MSKMNLKSQLRLYLKSAGFSVSELSRRATVPNATIAGWLTGRKPKDLDQVRRVAAVFQVSIDHLVYGNGCELHVQEKVSEGWESGIFEVRFRRIDPGKEIDV